MTQPVIAIVGTTGVGKTKLSIELATRFNGTNEKPFVPFTPITLSKVYRGLDIATNKVTPEEATKATHHLLSFVETTDEYSVSQFELDCIQKITEIHSRGHIPILVGGTHYYIQSVLWTSSLIRPEEEEVGDKPHPSIPDEVVERVGGILGRSERAPVGGDEEGWEEVVEELGKVLREVDPGLEENQEKLAGLALYLLKFYGPWCSITRENDIAIMQKQADEGKITPRYRSLIFWLWAENSTLDARLDSRVDDMINNFFKLVTTSHHPRLYPWYPPSHRVQEFDDYFNKLDEGFEDTEVRDRCLQDGVGICALDATDLEMWNENVSKQAENIVQDFINPSSHAPTTPLTHRLLSRPDSTPNSTPAATTTWTKHECPVCIDSRTNLPKVLHGDREWAIHEKSARHRRKVKGAKESEVWMAVKARRANSRESGGERVIVMDEKDEYEA
ncbi:IPP transferase-domain-containing protein [Chytridium lagenaria]|nr:IPP transferase-domain-containing protein [Chytridium lagenaria]